MGLLSRAIGRGGVRCDGERDGDGDEEREGDGERDGERDGELAGAADRPKTAGDRATSAEANVHR